VEYWMSRYSSYYHFAGKFGIIRLSVKLEDYRLVDVKDC
jgi:hypothetical protein